MGAKTRGNLLIEEMDKASAIEFIQRYHYSKILPRLTKLYLGVYELMGGERRFIGVISLGWGTQPLQTIKAIFPSEDVSTKSYYEIGKMCFIPEVNSSNYGSMILSKLVKYCRENLEIDFLYTLADGIMGKCGYVYQASNFVYLGSFKTSVYLDRVTGEKIHPRSAKKLCMENAEYEGREKVYWLTHGFCEYKGIDKINGLMFRYIYPLTKRGRKMVSKAVAGRNRKNPKSCDLIFTRRVAKGKFVEIDRPDFNMDVFNHNYQKY